MEGCLIVKVALVYNDVELDRARVELENPHAIEQLLMTISAMEDALVKKGHEVSHVVLPRYPSVDAIIRDRSDVYFNLTTGMLDKRMQLHAVAILEMAGVPFVGSGLIAHGVALDKYLAKVLLQRSGVNTPSFQLIPERGEWKPEPDMIYPAIIKPCREGSSLGITSDSVVYSASEAAKRGEQLREQFRQNMLLEELATGREFTAGVLGNDPVRIFPIQEILYGDWPEGEAEIYSFDAKVNEWAARACPADLIEAEVAEIERMCREGMKVLGLRDLARLDIRIDRRGAPSLLEVNALPGLQPLYSEYPRMAEAGGLSYVDLIDELVQLGVDHYPSWGP